jgi:ribosomal protein S7
MLNGNKQTSEKIILKSLKKLQKVSKKKNFNDVIKIGIIHNSPIIYTKNIKRKRKQTIEFPFLLRSYLRISYGIKFILKSDKQNLSLPFYIKLNKKFIESSKLVNLSSEKTCNLHKNATQTQKFANYRWF